MHYLRYLGNRKVYEIAQNQSCPLPAWQSGDRATDSNFVRDIWIDVVGDGAGAETSHSSTFGNTTAKPRIR